MTEWFRAGYFSASLLVKRHCDDRFYTLGELVSTFGNNPFQAIRFPMVKPEVPKLPDQFLRMQFMQEPWNQTGPVGFNALAGSRDHLLAQKLLSQSQVD